jgi:ribosomal protein S12 methylthiotransferase
VTEELIDAMADCQTLCKYVDFPVEHSDDAMLKRMNRGVDRAKMEWGIQTLRKKVKGVGLRTTIIVGFPGETEQEFKNLMNFLKETRFERLGAFKFSGEEGARAFDMPGQIPEEVKEQRFNAVMAQQQEISRELAEDFIGKEIQVLIDSPGEEPHYYLGRSAWDAPEVDGEVSVYSKKTSLKPGQIVTARVTDALEYDLVATLDE